MAKDIIKVPISVTLEVSRKEWDLAYGTTTETAEVQADVLDHILNLLNELTTGNHGAGDGAIKSVTQERS
jgi:hypothetical protein